MMSDLLERIAAHEEAIVREWSRALRDLPRSPYAQFDEDDLKQSVHRSAQALRRVMESGDTRSMQNVLEQSAARRIEEGVRYADNIAAWLVYRQVVQEVLREDLRDPDTWDQLVDRVNAVLDWVMRVIYTVYDDAGQVD